MKIVADRFDLIPHVRKLTLEPQKIKLHGLQVQVMEVHQMEFWRLLIYQLKIGRMMTEEKI